MGPICLTDGDYTVTGPASTVPRSVDAGGDAASHSPSSSPAPKAAAEAITVSTRDDFLLELGDALSGHVSIRPVESVAAALEHMSGSRRAQMLIIDTRDITDLRTEIERAHAHVPGAPVLAFAPAESEKTVAGALKGSNVFAVLPIPIDRRKTAAVFEGAIAEASAKRTAGRSATPERGDMRLELRQPLTLDPVPFVAAMEAELNPYRQKMLLWAIVAIAGLVLTGGAFWLLSGGRSHSEATVPVTQATPPAAPAAAPVGPASTDVPLIKGNVDELLEKARLAMRERRYTEPANDNALLYFRSALSGDAANAEARDGMTRVAGLLLSRYEDSIGAGRFDDASAALAGLRIAIPGDARLGALEWRLVQLQINKALAEGNLERAATLVRQAQQSNVIPGEQLAKWRAELAHRQDDARIRHLQQLFSERVRDGRLVDPENDNAKYYLQQLHEVPAASAVAQQLGRDLTGAYLRKARDAAVANHGSEADRWLAEARAAGATPADLNGYQRELASARQRAATAEIERLSQLTRDRLRDGHLTEPAQDSAAAYLAQLKDGYADNPAVNALGHELAARLMERATAEARVGQSAQLDADLALARRWGADPADIQTVQQLSAGRSSSSAQRSGVGALPPGVRLKRTRYSPPEYPDTALNQHVTGVVTVEFTVGLKGQPRDVKIVDSTPPKVFDHSAVSAVSRWRYEPVIINNVPTEIPTRMVIRFELPK